MIKIFVVAARLCSVQFDAAKSRNLARALTTSIVRFSHRSRCASPGVCVAFVESMQLLNSRFRLCLARTNGDVSGVTKRRALASIFGRLWRCVSGTAGGGARTRTQKSWHMSSSSRSSSSSSHRRVDSRSVLALVCVAHTAADVRRALFSSRNWPAPKMIDRARRQTALAAAFCRHCPSALKVRACTQPAAATAAART